MGEAIVPAHPLHRGLLRAPHVCVSLCFDACLSIQAPQMSRADRGSNVPNVSCGSWLNLVVLAPGAELLVS